jgi:hypothetical protein
MSLRSRHRKYLCTKSIDQFLFYYMILSQLFQKEKNSHNYSVDLRSLILSFICNYKHYIEPN